MTFARRPVARLNRGRIATAAPVSSGPGPLDPLSIVTSVAKVHYQIGDLGVTDAGGAVASAWNDQSGNARHFIQGTGAAQPAIETRAEINNKVALRFDGSNDVLACAGLNFAANTWVYIVFQPITFAAADGLIGASSAVNRMCVKQGSTTPQMQQQGNLGTNTVNAPVGQWHRLMVHFGTTTADSLTIDSTTDNATANTGTTAGTGRVIGALALASNFGNMRIAMVAAWANKPTADEVAALEAWRISYYGTAVSNPEFFQLYSTYWNDTDTSTVGGAPPNDYLNHESFANVTFTTSATSIQVSYVATSTDYSTFGVYVDGDFYSSQLCTGDSLAHTVSVSLPGGAHTVTLVEGPKSGGQTFLQNVTGNISLASKVTPVNRLVTSADSIGMGLQGTGAVVANMTRDAWPVALRKYFSGRVTSYGSGGRTFASDAGTGPLLTAFIAKTIAMLDGTGTNTLIDQIGTNDWGTATGAVWSAASFEAALLSWVNGVIAGKAGVVIYLVTPIIRQNETDTNTFGNTLEDYRQAKRNVVASVANPTQCKLAEAGSWLTLGDLVDGTHPSASGYAIMLSQYRTLLGI